MKNLKINAAIQKETEKAVFVSGISFINKSGDMLHYESVWLPKSKINISERQEYSNNKFCATFDIPFWLLKDKSFETEYVYGDNSSWVQVFRDYCE